MKGVLAPLFQGSPARGCRLWVQRYRRTSGPWWPASPGQGRRHNGPTTQVILNAQYLIDFLMALGGDRRFTMSIHGAGRPVVCETDDRYTYLVMPMTHE